MLAVAHGTLIRHALATITGHETQHYPKLDNASSSMVRFTDASWRVLTVGGIDFVDVVPALDGPAEMLRRAS